MTQKQIFSLVLSTILVILGATSFLLFQEKSGISMNSKFFKGDITANAIAPSCSLWYTENPEAIHWKVSSSVTKASFQCNEDTGNSITSDLVLTGSLSGTLPLSEGFPLKNTVECTMEVETASNVNDTCSFRQTILNGNGVVINGEKKVWHFPVSVEGPQKKSILYGGGSIVFGTDSATEISAENTEIVLTVDIKDGERISWSAPESEVGRLSDFTTKNECTITEPCSGAKVVFSGGSRTGKTSVLLENNTTKDSITYEVSTLESSLDSLSIAAPDEDSMYINDEIYFTASGVFTNGSQKNDISAEVEWEFSYDGGTSFSSANQDGIISGGKFIPYQSGQVIIRAKKTVNVAGAGDGKLSITQKEAFSENMQVVRVKKRPITIERAQLTGNTQIARNTTATIKVAISSPEKINDLQSISVSLLKGEVTVDSWSEAIQPAIVFQEYQNESSIKKYLTDEGGKNWGLLEIPVFIPEYDPNSTMKDGRYTFLVEAYTDHTVQSQAFIPAFIGVSSVGSCDVNNDGMRNVVDIIFTMKVFNKEMNASSDEKKRMDQNENGVVDLQDILLLFPCVLGENNGAEVEIVTNESRDVIVRNTPTPSPTPTPLECDPEIDPLTCFIGEENNAEKGDDACEGKDPLTCLIEEGEDKENEEVSPAKSDAPNNETQTCEGKDPLECLLEG